MTTTYTSSSSVIDRRAALKVLLRTVTAGLLALGTVCADGHLATRASVTTKPMADLARSQEPTPAAVQLNELAPENQALKQQVGIWDVTETSWDAPGAAPVTTTGLVAERRMVGAMLQEILRPMSDVSGKDIKRIEYLTFNNVSGQWEYVSMDTRADVALMPAKSFTRADADGKIVLLHEPFVIPGNGKNVTAEMRRMDTVITHQGPDRDMKEQHAVMSDGTGTVWLAHRYAYVRRR